MSDRQGVVLQDVVVFCFINVIYGIVPLSVLYGILPTDLFNSLWEMGNSTITATLWRVALMIALGAPIGIKFNDDIRDIWDRFTS
ncbi:MAG: hypothetical protein F3745_00795 [Nitrospinae bacterium]|nr:hypothetical protein [Nitrospinota bacterium]